MPIDYAKYHPDWKTIVRPRILARAGNRCEFCQVENDTFVERKNKKGTIRMTKIVLTVAHLDHNPEDWDCPDERLRALCQKCHLNYDRKDCTDLRVGRQRASKKYGRRYKKDQIDIPLTIQLTNS